jgi:class 3 adenylate cyclase
MSIPEIIGVVTGALTIVGTIVAVAIYMTRMHEQVRQAKLETAIDSIKEKLDATEIKYSELKSRHRETLVAGSYLAGKKQAIELQLALLSDSLDAISSSILVPVPSEIINDELKELVFLALLGPGSEKLKALRVSIEDSIAGEVFRNGKSRIIHKPRDESGVSAKTDEVSNTKSNEMLALPLIYKGECIGVIEFMNKRSGDEFAEMDQLQAERSIVSISTMVGEFIRDPNSFPMLGITPRKKAEHAAILFSDLSRSSRLIRSLDPSVIQDILNQYFEALCTVAITHGGRIDKFIGDGFMITFNVQHPVPDPELRAATAALEMNREFDAVVKKKWAAFNIPEIYNRIAIDSGPVTKVEIGHSQVRQITVMGDAVNTASNLCDFGSRDRNIVIIGESVYGKVSSKFSATHLKLDLSRQIEGTPPNAYELLSKN